jgi:hypothetical protein
MARDCLSEIKHFGFVNRLNGKYWELLLRTEQRPTGTWGYTVAEPRMLKTNQSEKEFCFES